MGTIYSKQEYGDKSKTPGSLPHAVNEMKLEQMEREQEQEQELEMTLELWLSCLRAPMFILWPVYFAYAY